MDRIIRILTTGKPPEVIEQGIVDAIQSGCRVLVKAGSISVSFSETPMTGKPDSQSQAIANWAENLSQEHGLVWQRVGHDVLFTRTIPEILNRK